MRLPFRIYPVYALVIFFITFKFNPCAAQSAMNKNYLTGRFNYRADTAFVLVPANYANRDAYLRKAAYAAYRRMYADALKEGIRLTIISGTRSFYDQVYKWESKWDTRANAQLDQRSRVLSVMRYSSMPGTSRHHWGTDMDLMSLSPAYFRAGHGLKAYTWLTKNAARYGFYQPFTANRRGGYLEEKWHWSYAPLAKTYLNQYTRLINYADIKGFPGSRLAGNINVIQNWVLQINPQCIDAGDTYMDAARVQSLTALSSKQQPGAGHSMLRSLR